MFYLGCDQHARQITICLRNEEGDVVLKRQVSTRPDKIRTFLEELGELLWMNRWRIAEGKRIEGMRQVILPDPSDVNLRKATQRRANRRRQRGRIQVQIKTLVRHDPWMRAFYRRLKKRRGAKIARVAVMRRLCTIIYRMLEKHQPCAKGGPTEVLKQRELVEFGRTLGREAKPQARSRAMAASG